MILILMRNMLHIVIHFFDTIQDPEDNRYLSEDYTFCRRLQKIGGEIWIDLSTKLNHVGSYTFEGDVSKIINSALNH